MPCSGEITEKKPVVGSTPSEVNDILKGWTSQKDPFHPKTQMSYYSADAEIVVAFKTGRAVGFAVIARRLGESLSDTRENELRKLITAFDPNNPSGMGGGMMGMGGVTFWSCGPVEWTHLDGGSKPLPKRRVVDPTPTPKQQADFAGVWAVTYPGNHIRLRELKPNGKFVSTQNGRWRVSDTHLELLFEGGLRESFVLPLADAPMQGTNSGAQTLTASKLPK